MKRIHPASGETGGDRAVLWKGVMNGNPLNPNPLNQNPMDPSPPRGGGSPMVWAVALLIILLLIWWFLSQGTR